MSTGALPGPGGAFCSSSPRRDRLHKLLPLDRQTARHGRGGGGSGGNELRDRAIAICRELQVSAGRCVVPVCVQIFYGAISDISTSKVWMVLQCVRGKNTGTIPHTRHYSTGTIQGPLLQNVPANLRTSHFGRDSFLVLSLGYPQGDRVGFTCVATFLEFRYLQT